MKVFTFATGTFGLSMFVLLWVMVGILACFLGVIGFAVSLVASLIGFILSPFACIFEGISNAVNRR